MDLYRRLADVRNNDDVESIREEMVDRFGELPAEATLLLEVAELRAFAKSLGVREVVLAGKYVRISPLTLPEAKQGLRCRVHVVVVVAVGERRHFLDHLARPARVGRPHLARGEQLPSIV